MSGHSDESAMSLLTEHRDQIRQLASRHGADDVRVFGSHARGQQHPESDLDLLVKLRAGSSLLDQIALQQDLEDLLGIPVDVVVEGGLSPHLSRRIQAEAISL